MQNRPQVEFVRYLTGFEEIIFQRESGREECMDDTMMDLDRGEAWCFERKMFREINRALQSSLGEGQIVGLGEGQRLVFRPMRS